MSAPETPRDPTITAIESYLRAGFSCIPVGNDKRPSEILPGRSWSAYQKRRATPAEWVQWWHQGARAIAIVCGAPSGGLYGLDGDDQGFNRWLLESGKADRLLANTWVALTGCGGPHVYAYSEVAVFSQILKSGNLKVADIRGDGQGQAGPSYLVAPPTHGICPKHGTEGTYRTISGSPDKIIRVQNAKEVYQWLANEYAKDLGAQPHTTYSVPVGSQGPVTRPAVPSSPDIPPPLDETARVALEKKIRDSKLSRKIRRALLQGYVAGTGDWTEVGDDNSRVDFALGCALVRSGFSEQEITDCFSTLHAGDHTFKNVKRPQHGMRYLLDYTMPAVRKAVAESEAALKVAHGLNFEVVDHLIVPFDDVPSYVTTLKTSSGRIIKVKLKGADFESDRSFCRAVWMQSTPQFMPQLQSGHTGANGFRSFMGLLGEMGRVEEDLPEGASETGYIQSQLLTLIRTGGVRHGTSDPQANSMGWIQGDWVIIRSEILISRVKGMLGRITAPQVWQAFSKLGGQAEPLKLSGRMEQVWMLPVEKVGFEDE